MAISSGGTQLTRPNIIMIMTDQQRFDTIAALGYSHMSTPTLDRFVAEGVTFTNAFVTAPSCAPARASLFTGYYPHTTGIYRNEDVWRRSWVELLSAAGYYTVNIGKMHSYPYETPLGFQERHVVENKDRYYPRTPFYLDTWDKALLARGVEKPGRRTYRERDDYAERLGAFEWEFPEDLHPDVYVGDLAIQWIRRHPRQEPLFLQIGFPGPHPPYDPIPRYAEPYLAKDLPLPSAVTDAELAAEPPALAVLRQDHIDVDHDAVVHQLHPSQAQLHRQHAYYYANITMIDEKIGEILTTLSDCGYLDDAVVVFLSDHGEALGEHGHSQKWTMYDWATRVPAIVWAPGRLEGGRRIEDQVQLMDFGPTILDLAEVAVPESMEAVSLLPQLRGESGGREYVFAEHARDGVLQGTELMTMVRHRRWKLVHFVDHPAGQLFDLEADPGEHNNLWNDPAHDAKKRELIEILLAWRMRSGLRTRAWSEEWR